MPNPTKYKNTKQDFKRYMSDYMSTAKTEGMKHDQAVAVALTRWRKEHGGRHPDKKLKMATADVIRKYARSIFSSTDISLVDPTGRDENWIDARIKVTLDPKTGKPRPKALIVFGTDPKEDHQYHKAEILTDILRLPEHMLDWEKHTVMVTTSGEDTAMVERALGDYHGKKAGDLLPKVKTALVNPEYAPIKGILVKMEKAFSENPGMLVRSS